MCVCVLFWEIMNTARRINYSNNSQASTQQLALCSASGSMSVFVCSCVCVCALVICVVRSSDNLLFVICYYIVKGFFYCSTFLIII